MSIHACLNLLKVPLRPSFQAVQQSRISSRAAGGSSSRIVPARKIASTAQHARRMSGFPSASGSLAWIVGMSGTESDIARPHYQYVNCGNVPMSGARSTETFATLPKKTSPKGEPKGEGLVLLMREGAVGQIRSSALHRALVASLKSLQRTRRGVVG
jgi:hypothetical protein